MDTVATDCVVITYNSARYIGACLDSIPRDRGSGSVIVVDNGSSDETLDIIRNKHPYARLVANRRNLGYSAAVNVGTSLGKSDVFVVTNADVRFQSDSFNRLIDFVWAHPHVGVAGPQLIFPDGSWQGSYCDLPGIRDACKKVIGLTSLENWARRLLWPRELDRSAKKVGWLLGAVMAIRRQAFENIGGFDERFHFYCEDADFCIRLHRAGWNVMIVPSSKVVHVAGASSTKVDLSDKFFRQIVESKMLLFQKILPAWQIPLYKRVEKLHSQEMLFGWRLIRRIGSRTSGPSPSDRSLMFERLVEIWTEECRNNSGES